MASACLNRIGISPENLLECSQKYSSYSWFSHRLSIGREMQEEDVSKSKTKRISSPAKNLSDPSEVSDPAKELLDLQEEQDLKEFDGFEFILDNPVSMLPADELFSDGKLVPMRLSVIHQEAATSTTPGVSGVRSPDTPFSRRITDESFATVDNNNQYLFSPRAPRCSSRWKELLGFRKLHQSSNNVAKVDINKRTSISSSSNTGTGATRSIRQFLNRSSKYSNDSSINLPLLKDVDTESVSVSSRPSLSSSSSGHDLDDLPRLSLDSDKLKLNLNMNPNNPPKTRMLKTRTHQTEARTTTRVGRNTMRRSSESTARAGNRGLSVDSPRMNSSGKIIFHSLERSSSSPSSFNGGPRFKYRGMERSYSANVRVTPVLNVPVCSLRGSSKSGGMFGFPIFSSQQKREGCSTGSNIGGSNRSLRFNGNR